MEILSNPWFVGIGGGLLSGLLVTSVTFALIVFLLKEWLKSSINAGYKKQHEVFIRDINRKNKIEIVSELLAEWIKNKPETNMSPEYRTRLNRLSFESTLWLSPSLSKELAKTLQLKNDAKNIFEILIMARKELIDDKELTPEDITFWDFKYESKYDVKNP